MHGKCSGSSAQVCECLTSLYSVGTAIRTKAGFALDPEGPSPGITLPKRRGWLCYFLSPSISCAFSKLHIIKESCLSSFVSNFFNSTLHEITSRLQYILITVHFLNHWMVFCIVNILQPIHPLFDGWVIFSWELLLVKLWAYSCNCLLVDIKVHCS